MRKNAKKKALCRTPQSGDIHQWDKGKLISYIGVLHDIIHTYTEVRKTDMEVLDTLRREKRLLSDESERLRSENTILLGKVDRLTSEIDSKGKGLKWIAERLLDFKVLWCYDRDEIRNAVLSRLQGNSEVSGEKTVLCSLLW